MQTNSEEDSLTMTSHLVEVFLMLKPPAKVLLPVGFGGTILRWGHKRWQKYQEDLVLSTFHNTEGPWQSANGVVGELYVKAALSDAPGYLPKMRRPTRGYRLAVMYRLRHFVRSAFLIPKKEKTDKILRALCFDRKILERAGWQHTDNEFYRLRNSVG